MKKKKNTKTQHEAERTKSITNSKQKHRHYHKQPQTGFLYHINYSIKQVNRNRQQKQQFANKNLTKIASLNIPRTGSNQFPHKTANPVHKIPTLRGKRKEQPWKDLQRRGSLLPHRRGYYHNDQPWELECRDLISPETMVKWVLKREDFWSGDIWKCETSLKN